MKANKIDFKQVKKAYFIGIGGIGISAIARMFLGEGKKVAGSDNFKSKVTDELKKAGAKIFIGHKAGNIKKDFNLVIYTNAVKKDNPEFQAAKKLKIPMMSYPEALGKVSADKFTIAIAGTHGKTTTSAMTAKILSDVGLSPMVIVGSLLANGSNFIAGKSDFLVVEADEYRRAFLNLSPKILVITSIGVDHLDYYKNLADIRSAFASLAEKVPADGFIICNKEDKNVKAAIKKAKAMAIHYPNVEVSDWEIPMPGEHNRRNAQAAATAAGVLGAGEPAIRASLQTFGGVWRRFELKGKTKRGAIVYDDYAHNPDKVRAALSGAREKFPAKKIIAVFQPHLFSRTKLLLKEFGKSFKDADMVFVAPIYAAREKNDPKINSEMLAAEIRKNEKEAVTFKNFPAGLKMIKKIAGKDAVVITIGAGDIYKLGESLVKK